MLVSRRYFFFGSLAAPVLSAKKRVGARPNLLLIAPDELPSWVLGAYGNKEVRTPNLDRLGQTGMRFLHHFACTPKAEPSLATLLSGRTPMQLGGSLAAGETTLTSLLGNLGYACKTADVQTAGEFLDQQAAGKPFFLMARHAGLQPPFDSVPRKYLDLYASATFDTFGREAPASNARRGKEMLADTLGSIRKYAAALTAFDDAVAVLLAKLYKRGLLDSTLVVFTSTCGALLGRHGLWDSGQATDPVNLYDEVIATPLIWSWPGHVPAQSTRPELISTYDLLPTVCELTGVPLPKRNLCGRSYLPLVTGRPLPKKLPWPTTVYGHYEAADMVREDRYKLVLRAPGKGTSELYDVAVDPREKVNQYGNQQFLTVRDTLAGELSRWKQKYSA